MIRSEIFLINLKTTPTIKTYPSIQVSKMPTRWYAAPMLFRIENTSSKFLEQEVLYSHLTLNELLNSHLREFSSVLDIGSHAGNVSNIFRFLGKKVTRCEVAPGYEAEYKQDYLDIRFPHRFEAIWCSQVLEHQRNVGIFLNKVFDDLEVDGLFALTVPLQVDMNLSFGHCNLFSPLILIYHLCLAGFCCREIKLRIHDNNLCIILRKKFNGIRRDLPFGSLPATDKTTGEVEINGKKISVEELLGEEIFPGMARSFPDVLRVGHTMTWPGIDQINWPQELSSLFVSPSPTPVSGQRFKNSVKNQIFSFLKNLLIK